MSNPENNKPTNPFVFPKTADDGKRKMNMNFEEYRREKPTESKDGETKVKMQRQTQMDETETPKDMKRKMNPTTKSNDEENKCDNNSDKKTKPTENHGENKTVDNSKTMEHANGKIMENNNAKTMEHANGKTMEHANGKTMEHANGKTMEQTNGKTMEHAYGKTIDHHAVTEVHKKSDMEEECMREKIRVKLLRECLHILKQEEQKYTKESLRRLFQDRDFLENLFRLFDHESKDYLIQEDWVEFLKERLVEDKQIDLAEQIESVSYVLCGDDVVTFLQFCQIFQAKGIVDKIFRLIDLDNIGTATPNQVLDFLSTITSFRSRTGFDKGSLEWLEKLFRETVKDGNEIRREDFQKIVVSKNPFFTERVFQIFDKDNSGSISLQEFLDSMHQFAGQSPDDKIRFLFKVYDLDGDGLIQQRELRHVLRACMEENGMNFNDQQILDLSDALLEDADPLKTGTITLENLKNQLGKHGGLLENLSISIDRWLVPPKPKSSSDSKLAKMLNIRPYQLSIPYLKNNYVFLMFFGAFIILNIGLFVSRAIQYRHSNGFVIVARACGQCLNFDCMWVLVLMLRRCITFLRTRGFGLVLPLDQHIYLHKVTGMLIFFFSVLHTIMHLCNFSIIVVNDPVINKANYTISQWLFTDEPGLFGLVGGCANPTGFALIIILIIMFICSQAFVRRGGSFEVFYWTHLLYIPFWIILIFHGPNFWKWFIGPGLLYIIERISRLTWITSKTGRSYISSGILLPSKVTHLVIKRPLNFDYHPGDYVFVNIPAIAKYEWHPFTISSAPEQEDYIWLHVRGVGQWTNRLYEWFENQRERLHAGEVPPVIPKGTNEKLAIELEGILKKRNSLETSNCLPPKKKSIEFAGIQNGAFVIEEDKEMKITPITPKEYTQQKSQVDKKIAQLLLRESKTPLEKTRSMPDIQVKTRAQQRIQTLKEYVRSESEKCFDENLVHKANMQALGLAYFSPQNKTLAQSFRYMRNKPTIIAFKTPSLENCEQRDSNASIVTLARRRLSKTLNPDKEKDPEEGHTETAILDIESTSGAVPFVNYPVGKPLEIFIDGPYGTPSSHIFRAQHAVLVGTGIGVTPYASILQSIMHRYWKARHRCPQCKFTWASDIPPTVMNLRKVDFFWINREQRSFEWFVSLLSQLEMEQAELGGAMERFLDMHMYITSALQRCDMKAVGLQLALDLLHEKGKRDLITGLKTRTNAGRPNWDKVFKQIKDQKKGKVTVFYCGPPQLARILRMKCDQFGFSFRKEAF